MNFSYYNKRGIIFLELFGFGFYAKNTAINDDTGSREGVHRFGNWVFLFACGGSA